MILPKRNKSDLEEVPEEIRKKLNFVFVEHVDEVLRAALPAIRDETSPPKRPGRKTGTPKPKTAAAKGEKKQRAAEKTKRPSPKSATARSTPARRGDAKKAAIRRASKTDADR